MAAQIPKAESPAEREKIYYALFENSMDAIFVAAPDRRIFFANPAACTMFERTEKEICDLGVSGIIDISDPIFGKAISEQKQAGHYFGELSGLRRDGSLFPIYITASVFTDSQGELRTSMIVRDISESKKMEEDLRKSEFQLKVAQKTAHIGSWDYDVASDKVSWSDEMYLIFERNPSDGELSWMQHKTNIYEEDWSKTDDAVQKAINEGKPYEVEFRIIKSDKSLKWASAIGKVEKDSRGKVLRLFGTVQDISERKKDEEALKKSELLLRTILGNAPIAIFATDRQGVFTLSDGNELKHIGLKPGELVGTSAFDLYNLHPLVEWSGKKLTGKDFLNLVLAGENITVTYELNGVWFENHISPILNEDGKVMGIVGIATNITERKLAEDNFLEVEGRYRLLSEQSGIGIGLFSPTGEILYFNNMALNNMGGRAEEYTGKLLTEVFGEQAGKEYLNRIRKAIRTGKIYDYEDFVQIPSGSYWFLSNHIRVCNSKGKVIGVQVLSHDITKIKRTEEELKRSTEEYRTLVQHIEEEMENERTQIARDLHDDLGQKLTILSMDISWLKSRIGAKSRSVDNKLNEMVHFLTETVDSIKKISFGLRPSILDDLGIRAAIKWQLSDFSKTTGITSSLVILPKDLAIDKTLSTVIFRIIQESLTNVVRHSEAKKVSVILNSGEGTLKLMIRDNGKGIEPGQINDPKSFGLIGIRERARSHGGKVRITGKKGVGTLVLVVIPVE